MKRNGKATPRRPIEREYLAMLNAAVPLDTWQAICKRAADDALAGDARARDWLAKWLLGLESRLLTVLAAEESGAEPAEAAECEIAARRKWRNAKLRPGGSGGMRNCGPAAENRGSSAASRAKSAAVSIALSVGRELHKTQLILAKSEARRGRIW